MTSCAFVSVAAPLRLVGGQSRAVSRCDQRPVVAAGQRARLVALPRSRRRRARLLATKDDIDDGQKAASIIPLALVAITANLANRVIYRMQLVPMQEYIFLISQFVTVIYALVYGSILLFRKQKGHITPEMLDFAKENWKTFALIGLLEALALPIGFYAAAQMPGTFISVLQQGGMLFFTMLASFLFLGKRFAPSQLLGVTVLLAGTATCVLGVGGTSSLLTGSFVDQTLLQSIGIFLGGLSFMAGAVTLKEGMFGKGVDLDIFVVNTAGSTAQAAATLLLMPIVLAVATPLPPGEYISNGLQAFFGATSPYMPWLGFGFVTINIIFNTIMLLLLSRAGAVTSLITSLAGIPLTSLVFCLPLPLLGQAAFGSHLIAGLVLILAGVLLYNKETMFPTADAADD